eukprot:9496220-Pyramimonas_sp.AAC.3
MEVVLQCLECPSGAHIVQYVNMLFAIFCIFGRTPDDQPPSGAMRGGAGSAEWLPTSSSTA